MTAIYFHNDPVYIYINIISHENLQFVWDAYGCVVFFTSICMCVQIVAIPILGENM